MSTFLPAEKGTPIRMPSTANLMLDSADRNTAVNPSPWVFQIQRPQALLNGFFTRIGTTEVVLEWNVPNISSDLSNNWLQIDLSGTVSGTISTTRVITTGVYTAAELVKAVAAELSDVSGSWTAVAANGGGATIEPAADVYVHLSGPVADALGIDLGGLEEVGPTAGFPGLLADNLEVDLRPCRYLDFVSAQLTYNQDLKDGATNNVNRDVLCRWYMAYDNPPQLDEFGFPILMGYTPFTLRRIFSPPKQIRWDNIQPLGNLSFEVFTDKNVQPLYNPLFTSKTNWLMTLQVSEV
jgi:hypothetical protein